MVAFDAAREALRAHFVGERDGDLDATMASFSEHPTWRLGTHQIEGVDAIRAAYKRSLPLLVPGWMDECLRALDDPTVTHWGDAHCVIEYSQDYPLHFAYGWVMVVHFDGDRMASENSYPTTVERPAGLADAIGPDAP